MLTLLASLLAPVLVADTVPPVAAAAPDPAPAIQITLDNSAGNYFVGQHVGVRVQTRDDGYLIVFRVNADGQIQVLFPLDPDLDAFTRGGKEYEIRSRDGQEGFQTDVASGTGLVYAAVAREPYALGDFVTNHHWDYGALQLKDSTTDAENALTDIVSRMTNHARFDYDAVAYHVQDVATSTMTGGAVASTDGGGYYSGFYDPAYDPAWRCFSCGWGYPQGGFNMALGGGFYDPYYYDPFYDPYYAGFGFGLGFGNVFYPGYPVYVSRPIGIGHGVGLGHGLRPRPRPVGVGVSGRLSGGVSDRLGGSGIARPSAGAPVMAARPRPGGVSAGQPAVAGVRPGMVAPTASGAVRARPRGNEEVIIRRSGVPAAAMNRGNEGRPVFREPRPAQGGVAQPAGRSGQPTREYRPAYREPPQAQRPANNPPPQQHSPPPQPHNNPPPRPAPSASRGGGGGGRPAARGRP